MIPTTSAMLKRALYWPRRPLGKGPRDKTGDIPKHIIVEIARIQKQQSRANTLRGTAKEVLGVCRSMGHEITIDGISITESMQQIDDGLWDEELFATV